MGIATRDEILMSLTRLMGDVGVMVAAADRKELLVVKEGTRARIAEVQDILKREAIETLVGTGYAVRYCPACGLVGPVPGGAINCCPNGNHAVEVPHNIAVQAQAGFKARLSELVLECE